MKIHENCLSHTLLQKCVDELKLNFSKRMWASSNIIWSPDITIGIIGTCLISEVSLELSKHLSEELKQYFPESNELTFWFQVWQQNSGISLHSDKGYKFASTIYLNQFWDINWGGIFIWKNKSNEEFRALVPKLNMMVLNDSEEDHLVTPVSPESPELRCTIQVWGKY